MTFFNLLAYHFIWTNGWQVFFEEENRDTDQEGTLILTLSTKRMFKGYSNVYFQVIRLCTIFYFLKNSRQKWSLRAVTLYGTWAGTDASKDATTRGFFMNIMFQTFFKWHKFFSTQNRILPEITHLHTHILFHTYLSLFHTSISLITRSLFVKKNKVV